VDLSIVIINYNVKAFLTQCLDSIYRSQTQYNYEVIVIDNASADSGKDMILKLFPKVRWTDNAQNVGFGKANNQGFEQAKGAYTLILNPDTVLREDTLEVSLNYLKAHPEVGGLGIKGIDGSGQFLPESKRGLPTPMTAFFKISGLSRLFPRSPLFSRYHLGHLDPDSNHKVDILVGCYMMVPTDLLRQVGGFDPQYFMYGEDIDLSYELLKTGHQNHYLAESQIIHYKGESTKRGSLNYVRMFYQAMVLFARKQFSGGSALAYTLLIYTGIYLRAGLAILARLGRSAAAPLIDAAVLAIVLEQLKSYWESNHRFINGGSYPDTYTYYVQGSYVLIWILGLWFSGTYSKHARPTGVVRSMVVATLLLGFGYGLLPEDLRFSRGNCGSTGMAHPVGMADQARILRQTLASTSPIVCGWGAKKIGPRTTIGRAKYLACNFHSSREPINRFGTHQRSRRSSPNQRMRCRQFRDEQCRTDADHGRNWPQMRHQNFPSARQFPRRFQQQPNTRRSLRRFRFPNRKSSLRTPETQPRYPPPLADVGHLTAERCTPFWGRPRQIMDEDFGPIPPAPRRPTYVSGIQSR
jgi:GT2 family glycosyltransferase